MRISLLLFLLLAAAGALPAQLTFTPDTIRVDDVHPGDFEQVGYATVYNAGADTVTIRWIREIVQLTEGWQTAVCDRNFCHDPVVESEEVVVPAGDSTNMDVHVYPQGVKGTAAVRVSVVDLENPEDTLRAVYLFSGALVDVNEVPSIIVGLFPNPATEWFTVEAHPAAARIEVLTLEGKQVAAWPYAVGEAYPLVGLPAATYLVQVRDREGRPVGRQLLQKR